MRKAKIVEDGGKGKNRLFIIIIAATLAAILLFGVVLGTIALVTELNAVVSYNGVSITKGVASYLASTFKASYKETEGETLAEATERYIRAIVVAASLYDRHASLSREDNEWIETNVKEILDYKAGNDKAAFNSEAAGMGFSYDDFVSATKLIYKANKAKNVIYGAEGTKLAYQSNVHLCEEYFASFAHVKIIFIRTEDRFAIDENGDRIPDENGDDMLISLDPDEKAARLADIAEIEALMAAANAGTGEMMSLITFDSYYGKYNDDPQNKDDGYYFSPNSSFTAEYYEEYPNLIEKIFDMKIGEWGTSTDGTTVCAIYRYGPIPYDYLNSSMQPFFSDFYADCADYLFADSIDTLGKEVNVKAGYYEIDLVALKKNSLFKTPLGIGIQVGR